MSLAALKLTLRVLARRKVFTAISLFGVSFTLATLMVVAALLDRAFGSHAPDPDHETTVGVYALRLASEHWISSGLPGFGFIDKQVRPLRTPEQVVAISSPEGASIYESGRKFDVQVRDVEAPFWEVTRFRFLEGAPFTEDDDRQARQVAVINAATRTRLFGDAPGAGRELEFEGRTFRVVGVVADVSEIQMTTYSDVWLPMGTRISSAFRDEIRGGCLALVKLRSPKDKEAARAELAMRLSAMQLPAPYTEIQTGLDTPLEAASREMLSPDMRDARPHLVIALFVTLGVLFMVLPAVNLANLAISRALERAAEIGVRKAFGASGRQLIGQLLFENFVLTLIGGAVSIPLAALTLAVVNRSGLITYADFGINVPVLLWGLLAAGVFSVLSGLYPAWRLSRLTPAEAMRGRLS